MENFKKGFIFSFIGVTLIAGATSIQGGLMAALLCYGIYFIILGIVIGIQDMV